MDAKLAHDAPEGLYSPQHRLDRAMDEKIDMPDGRGECAYAG
jgi:hypothetical protein